MTIAELKKELHTSIEKTDDEQLLLEVSQFLSLHLEADVNLLHEELPEFKTALTTSITQAENNEVYSYESTMKWLNDRAWRTK